MEFTVALLRCCIIAPIVEPVDVGSVDEVSVFPDFGSTTNRILRNRKVCQYVRGLSRCDY